MVMVVPVVYLAYDSCLCISLIYACKVATSLVLSFSCSVRCLPQRPPVSLDFNVLSISVWMDSSAAFADVSMAAANTT